MQPPNESSSSHTNFSGNRTVEVIAKCQHERSIHRNTHESASPACVEIFRRAFAGDQEAWAAILLIFKPLIRAWIGVQTKCEYDDIFQDALLAFHRAAPAQPSLVSSDDLGSVLAYLRRAIATAILMCHRAHRRSMRLVQLHSIAELPASGELRDDPELRSTLRERIERLIENEEEQIIFELFFVFNMKQQDIVKHQGALFSTVKVVNTIVQRLKRRFRKDPIISGLADQYLSSRQKPDAPASLEIRVLDDTEDRRTMDQPCALDEGLLLDYIMGDAPAEIRAAIERSPACVAAVQQLEREIMPLRQILYRLTCPEIEDLLAYHEQRLTSTKALVIHRHMMHCAMCQEEFQLVTAIYAIPLVGETGVVRRIIAAIYRPAHGLPQPLRGGGSYQSPQLTITLNTHHTHGKRHTWTLRGEVQTTSGESAISAVESVLLQQADQSDRQTTLADDGTFIFQGLAASTYRLSFLTEEEEVVIHPLTIGDDL